MNNVIIRPKSREEWLEHRKNGIGSSEVATIVGLNPWETPYQLWRRKLGLDPAKDETFAMKAGHYLEDAVAMFWHDETGREIIKRSAGDWIIANKERPYLQVSPDRTYWLTGMAKNNTNKGILECKTTQMKIDGDDLPHRGFETFCHLLDRYEPRYFIHGHVHKTYGCDFHRYDKYKNTEIINAYEYCIFEYEPVTAEG